jgi:O-antigen/teichoic acid export membrane protein
MSRVRRNTLALVALQVVNVLLPMATLPYLFRVLGPEQFGVYSLAQAVLLQGVILTDFGFNLSATQRVAQAQNDRVHVGRIYWSVQAAKLVLGLLGAVLLAAAVWLVPTFHAIWPVLLGGSPIILAAILFPQWLFQGLERMSVITACSVSARVAALPLVFLLVDSPDDAWLAALVAASGPCAAGLAALVVIHRQGLAPRPPLGMRDVRSALRDGWPLFVSSAAINLYTTMTPVLLGLLSSTQAVGVFSAADRLRQAVQALLTPLAHAAFPRISARMSEDTTAGMALVRRLLWLQGGLTLGASVLLWITAPRVVMLLAGSSFEEAVAVLRILAAVPFIVGLSNVLGIQTMLPLGLKRAFSLIVIVSSLVNLGLLGLLSPRWGAQGAALAILATESIVLILMALVLWRTKVILFKTQPETLWT